VVKVEERINALRREPNALRLHRDRMPPILERRLASEEEAYCRALNA